jgi:hypothetical protein
MLWIHLPMRVHPAAGQRRAARRPRREPAHYRSSR